MKEDRNDELANRQGISPNLVDAVRQVLAGKRDEEPVAEAQDEVVDEAKQPKMKNTKTDIAGAALDPVDKRALKGKHKDRKDKDIDNDGDVDDSDKYLHKRRKAVAKAMEAKEYCDCDCDCGKKVCESCDKPHKPEDIEEDAQMVRGADGQIKYKTSRMPLSLQRMARRKRPLAKRVMRSKVQVNSYDPTEVEEGAMSRIATQSAEKKRLGADKVKGSGLDTYKKKPAKDTLIANPRNQRVRKVTPSRAKMAVKKGFVYAEHMEGLEEADAFKGQPVGVSVTMKHKSGKKVTTKFPGTHSAVAGAKSHISQMQKKGYSVHSKDLMYGKNEASMDKLSKYMQKSAASVSGKDAKTQDKRIAGQSMADKKIRKGMGYSSDAKVAATEGKDYLALGEGNYAVVSRNGPMITKKSKVHGYVKTMPKGKNLDKLLDKHGADTVIHRDKLKSSDVSEARRGRPAKTPAAGTQDTETRHNIVHQLRKSVSLRGNHKVEFKDGKSHKISQQHAAQALNKYNSLRTTGEKANYQKQLHHSHDSFHTARQSKTPGAAPKKPGISLGGSDKLKKLLSKD